MAKLISHQEEARDALKRGVDQLANSVKVTLGPKGRHVIIEKIWTDPVITKDGVTVAREINLPDPMENLGAQMVKQVASKTADAAGDGTTTATVLAQAIITAGMKNVAAGANPMDLKRGIDKAVLAVVKHLEGQAVQVKGDQKKIIAVGTISSNNDEVIGKLIAEAMAAVGDDGVITVEEAKGTETEVKTVEGMSLDRGYLSPFFITDKERIKIELQNVDLLIYDRKITHMKELMPLLEKQVKRMRPLLIIADDVDGDALSTLVINKVRGALNVAAIKAPGFGEMKKDILEDIAVLTGGTLISPDRGFSLESATVEMLGRADKVTVDKESTIIVNGAGGSSDIKNRCDMIRTELETANGDFKIQKLKERLAKLSGGVAVLYIGAKTEVELKEKKDRVDDALHATRAAIEEGIVPGGGVAYIRAIDSLIDMKGSNEDENTGIQIIRRAIEEPLRQICENAGMEGSIVIQKVRDGKKDYGYNARTDVYEHLIKAGVIDPTKVTRVALENAASVAALVLTTECVLTEIPVDASKQQMMPNMN